MASSVFPQDWSDDGRMSFMFSPFPSSRGSNTSHWDSKLHFWSDVISSHCRQSGRLTFTLKELEQTFIRKKSIPACLDVVLSEMYQQKKIQTRKEFLNSETDGWIGWGMRLVIGTFQRLSGYGGIHIRGSDFVTLTAPREKVSEIMERIYEQEGDELVMSRRQFGVLCKETDGRLRNEDIEVIVCQLRRERRISSGMCQGVEVVRLAGKHEAGVSPTLSETDKAVFGLKTTSEKLTNETEELGKEVKRLRHTALEMHKQKNEQAAKASLRRSKVLEKSLQRSESTLSTIEIQLEQLRSTKTQQVVVSSIAVGVAALRNELKDSELSADRIDEVMDDVREVLDDSRDINDALSAANVAIYDPDMEELERELEQLVIDDGGAAPLGISQQLDMLPSVPTTTPVNYRMSERLQPPLNSQQTVPRHEPTRRPTRDQERAAELA